MLETCANSARSIPVCSASSGGIGTHSTTMRVTSCTQSHVGRSGQSEEVEAAALHGSASDPMFAGSVWTSAWEALPPRLQEALLPSARAAWAARLCLATRGGGAEAPGGLEEGEAWQVEASGREEALSLAVEGLQTLSLDECEGVLGLLDGLCVVASLAALERAGCGEQWRWVSILSNPPCIARASVRQSEIGVNELAVRDKLGGGDLLRRSLAVGLLGRLGCALAAEQGQGLTQLNILCKNIAGTLQAVQAANPAAEDDEDGAALQGMCSVCAVGSLCMVATHWAHAFPSTRDPPFLLLSTRLLFSLLRSPSKSATAAWCRWTAAHGLARLTSVPEVWRSLSKKAQTDTLKGALHALEATDLDATCRALCLRAVDNPATYAVALNLPNYLSQLLSRLLALLPPVSGDPPGADEVPLNELRWAALGFIARFLAGHMEGGEGAARREAAGWAGACAAEGQVLRLRECVREAFVAYCHTYSLPLSEVRLPG